jgi:predicted metal-dependent phosphoesterase TrpH
VKIEFHCHTRISDGSMTFEQVLQMAKKEQISHLAITNHDTTQGLEQMVVIGAQAGVEIIPGIEISAYDHSRKRRVHILGYYVTPAHPAIGTLCMPICLRRHQASQQSVLRLIKAGYHITWEQVLSYAVGGTGVYKQHIMHALIDRGYTDGIYSALYRELFARGNDQQPPGIAYVPMTYVDAKEAVETIITAGGVPVLAHPGQYKNFEIIPELVKYGLSGVEVYHPTHGPAEESEAKRLATEYELIETGGSDFHGFYDEMPIVLGSRNPGVQALTAIQAKSTYYANHRK